MEPIAFRLTREEYLAAAVCAARTQSPLIGQTARRVVYEDWEVFDRVRGDMTVSLAADEMHVKGACLTQTEVYALYRGCVETRGLFVFMGDADRFFCIPKRAMKEEHMDFLRQMFVRKMKTRR